MKMKVICLVTVVGFAFFGRATTITVSAGDSHTITASENSGDNVVQLNDGSTLAVSSDLGEDVVLKARVKILANASAILSVGDGVSSLNMQGGLYALDGASLSVTGIGSMTFGKSATESAINTPPLDIATLTFSDDGATGLTIVDSATIRQAPTNCPLSIASGANLALFGTNTLAPFGITGDFTLSDFDIVLLSDTAIATNNTITVNPGRTIAIKPCIVNGDWNWAGTTVTFNTPSMVLGGDGARCLFRGIKHANYKYCPVSGEGDVIFKPDSASTETVIIYGPFTYSGVFAVDNASYVQTYTYAWGSGTRSLRMADGAMYRPNGVSEFSSLSSDGSVTLELLFNTDLTIGNVTGGTDINIIAASGAVGGKVDFTGTFPAPFSIETDGTALCRFSDGDPAGALECATDAGITYRWPDASGVIDCSGLSLGRGHSRATLFSESAVLTNASATLCVASTGTAVVATTSAGASVRAEAGGTVSYVTAAADWQSNVFLWIDPSTAEFVPVGGHESNKASVNGNTVFASISDVRSSQTTYALWNRRDTTATKSGVNWQVYPLAVASSCNGLTTMSLGPYETTETLTYEFDDGSTSIKKNATSARRILLAKDKSVAAETGPQSVGAVTMVFGSQNGGGGAIVGTLNGAFGRTGTTLSAGMTTNTSHRIFLNGVQVADPASQKLSGGWDVITVEMDGEKLSAFGWVGSDGANNDYKHCGGQNYGEIIVFTSVPSDGQRISAERYLAEKWGLTSKFAGITNDIVLSGSGTVRTDGVNANASGRFSGTIDLAGGSLTIAPRGDVPDETSVPTNALAGWFDPDDEDNILLNKDTDYSDAATRPNALWAVYDKSRPSRSDGDAALFAPPGRRPVISSVAHGDGPVRNWIHFTTEANLRFRELPLPDLDTVVVAGQALEGVREIFVVQDSSRGGGTPIIDRINTTDSTDYMKILPRRTPYAYMPIWNNTGNSTFTDAIVTCGVTRVNGTVVDGCHAGFTGRDEVFSFTTTADYSPIAVADLWNQSVAGSSSYEMIGETLFYTQVLSDDDRQNVIDYLNAKWRGVLPEGSGDFSGATVTGSGNVIGEVMAYMPMPSSTFSGTFTVSENADCEFTVYPADGSVTGAVTATSTTFNLPAAATATVNVSGKMSSNHVAFELIDCAGFESDTAWTLNLVNKGSTSGCLRTQGGKLILDLYAAGTMVIIR